MPQTFSSTSQTTADPFMAENIANNRGPLEDAGSVFEQMQVVLTAFQEQPDSAELWQKLVMARRVASEAVTHLPRKDTQSLVVHDARQLIKEIIRAGVADRKIDGEDVERAADIATKNWPGLLAVMMLAPAWQLRAAPLLSDVPDWLAADYVNWLFAAPRIFLQPGDAEAFAKHAQIHVQDLSAWVQRNAGSPLVRTAAETYLRMDLSRSLAVSAQDLKSYAVSRGAIAKRILFPRSAAFQPVANARVGRRLRVGILAEHFGVGNEVRLLLPLFSQLDRERFDIQLISGSNDFSALGEVAGEQPVKRVLPADDESRLSSLQSAELDVLVFGANLSQRIDGISRLALHRIAPLQVALPLSFQTTGLPTVDLFVAGEQLADQWSAGQFTERLGLWRGVSHGVSRELGRQSAGQAWTKASLGIAEDAVVFVSEAAWDFVTPETMEVWAELLAKTPGSQLILHPFGAVAPDAQTTARFGALMEAACKRHNVDTGRLLLSTLELSNPGDVQALLSVGDIYLETLSANTVEGLLRAFEAGLPVIACEGQTLSSGVGAAWLRSLGLEELVAKDAAAYQAAAHRLAADGHSRLAIAGKIKKSMTHLPPFADALAMSDGFGSLLETAFDQMIAGGAKTFASERSPLRPAATAPSDMAGRWNLGRELLNEGRAARAVDFLMAALACDEGTAALWLDVARALRATGQSQDAIQALETALRLDQKMIDGWRMMAELADLSMIPDLAAEARRVVDMLDSSRGIPVGAASSTAPKMDSIVGKLRSLRTARRGAA